MLLFAPRFSDKTYNYQELLSGFHSIVIGNGTIVVVGVQYNLEVRQHPLSPLPLAPDASLQHEHPTASRCVCPSPRCAL